MTTPVEWELKSTGDERVAAAFEKVNRSVRDADATQRRFGEGAVAAAQKLGGLGSTLGLVGAGVGRFNQGAGRLVSILGQATGSIGAMSSMFGPWGIAIGIATTAFGLLSSAVSDTRSETDRATTSVRRHAEAVREALPTLNQYIQAIRGGLEAAAQHARIRSAQGSVVEQRAAVEQLRAQLDAARAQSGASDDPLLSGAAQNRIAFLEAQLAGAEERLQTARSRAGATGATVDETPEQAAARLARENRSGGRGGGGGRRTTSTGARGYDPIADLVAEARARNAAALERGMGGGGESDLQAWISDQAGAFSDWQRTVEQAEENERKFVEASRDAAQVFADSWKEGVGAVVEAFERANEAAAAAGERQVSTGRLMAQSAKATGQEILDYLGDAATDALRSNVEAWLSGSKSFIKAAGDMAKGVVQALVAESVVQALVNTARGFMALASYQPQAAVGFFTAAALWGSVAGVAGGVGLATGAIGGGGRRGGGPSLGRDRDFEPARMRADSGGGATNLTLIVNAPVDNPRAMGLWMLGHIREARRFGGHEARLDD